MDDILLAAATPQELDEMENKAFESLNQYGLVVAPEKVQRQQPWLYLAMKVLDQTVTPQPIKLQVKVKTLNNVQKLAGVINWVRPYVGTPSSQLQPLFDLLRGDTDISAPCTLMAEAQVILEIEQAISNKHVWRTDLTVPMQAIVVIDQCIPFTTIAQWHEKREILYIF